MAENTKTPPNQDPRRTTQGDPDKPQKPGTANPNRPEIDPDRDRQNRGKPMGPGKDGSVDVDDLDDDDDSTQRMQRE